MSGHWFKVVSGACKPKHVPPKSKYIDSLVSSTYQADGSFQDVSRALRSKLRDPNSSVVFKALLVIHTLTRAGNAEEVMTYWSGVDGRDGRSLGLKDVVATTDTPQNLSRYANYLLARFKCYASLKHDPIRTRSEAPASLRHSSRNGANRLRTLTVEKGLLREVGTLQKLMDALVDCKFYLEDTDDDLVMSALRLLVKDLLVLFQAVNEGVINVLEHYFEMSHVDATTALKTYKVFCKQCERVVAYLGVAKKLQNIINVNIPNLRHAPVSLAGSLEEYLNDPNFETNRQEYRESKRVADGRPPSKSPTPKPKTSSSATPAPTTQSTSQPADSQKAFIDFFESIESEQQSMFNPSSLSPSSTYFQQQATVNPFGQPSTGFPQVQTIFPQQTGMIPTTSGRESMGHALFGGFNGSPTPQFVQVQPTGWSAGVPSVNSLQPQMTGAANPFRQSMFNPNAMGNMSMMPSQPTGVNPFSQFTGNSSSNILNNNQSLSNSPWSNLNGQPDRSSGAMSAPPIQAAPPDAFSVFSSSGSASPTNTSSMTTPLKAQVTGSRNPFAALPGSGTPPVPKLPSVGGLSLNALAASAFSQSMVQQRAREQAALLQFQQQQQKQQQISAENDLLAEKDRAAREQLEQEAKKKKEFQDFFSQQLSKLEGGGKDLQSANMQGTNGLFSNVASEFAVTKPNVVGEQSNVTFPLTFGLTSQPTGFPGAPNDQSQVNTANERNIPTGFTSSASLLPQKTGFGGSSIKPFQPSSSFGASLAAQLEPKPPAAGQVAPGANPSTGPFSFNPSIGAHPVPNSSNQMADQDLMGFSNPNNGSNRNPLQPSCIPNPTASLI